MRNKPYTKRGISRVPCFACGESSSQQWQICALNNEWKGLCSECDIELNYIVLKFMKIPSKEIHCLIEDYKDIRGRK